MSAAKKTTKASPPNEKGSIQPASPATPAAKQTNAVAPATPEPTAIAKEPEAPHFEKSMANDITKHFGDSVQIVFIKPLRIKIMADPSNVVEVATFIRDSMGYDHAECAGGTDYPKDNQIEVVYHLGSYGREDLAAQILMLAVRTNRDDPHLPTLINVYKSVEYHERETFEMLGVYFDGHPRNDRFLLPEDWADLPPLRKDFRIKGR